MKRLLNAAGICLLLITLQAKSQRTADSPASTRTPGVADAESVRPHHLAGKITPAPQPHAANAQNQAAATSPWGVAAHPNRPAEWNRIDSTLQYLNTAGIRWMRQDFSFSYICRKRDSMQFERYDQLMDKTQAAGVQVLPILQGYDWELKGPRPDAVPLYNHPEEWRKYVRATVQRYHGRLKYWEIWNEQDGGFWKPHPHAAQYVQLLRIAHEEIKAIDPGCKVVVGGFISWNADYLKAMYQAGAKDYFDVLAVHPYGWPPDVNTRTAHEREQFYSVMKEYGQSHIPVWITECGGASFKANLSLEHPDFMLQAVRYALGKIAEKKNTTTSGSQTTSGAPVADAENNRLQRTAPENITIGIALSPRTTTASTERSWLPGIRLQPVPFNKLAQLDPADCPVLIGGEGLNVDEPLLEPLREYVKRGGLLVAVNKLPFFAVHSKDAAGNWHQADKGHITYPFFRMAYEASWTKKDIPAHTEHSRVHPDAITAGLPEAKEVFAARYLSDRNLQPGDRYHPIVQALYNNQVIGETMALYTYHDWKGGILISTASVENGYTETSQANLLQRVYLSYLALGIQKIFWYDLHNDGPLEGEPEHNFGLFSYNWEPKPAAAAYAEMAGTLGNNPAFIQRLPTPDPSVWALVFQRAEDKKQVLAVWSVNDNIKYRLLHNHKTLAAIKGTKVQFVPLKHPVNQYRVLP